MKNINSNLNNNGNIVQYLSIIRFLPVNIACFLSK